MDQDRRIRNGQAWSNSSYTAWVNRFGTPEKAVSRILKDPKRRLQPLDQYVGDVSGKKIVNLLGSHGSKAVALSLLGAETTVIDISDSNAAYARELASAANVDVRYVVEDILNLPESEMTENYDMAFMENGILHYFADLNEYFSVVAGLLKKGGTLILQDFHPISTKLIESQGKSQAVRKHKVSGDYFSEELVTTDVAYSKFIPELQYATSEERAPFQVQIRQWTLGEIITAIGSAGLWIKQLVEEPHPDELDRGIPKSFIIVAEKL
ncbi:class I SAM-dependent methyltransferase [Fictibacillus phosphorivorans]|uniref:class I SAM-dependent methyltransferase n=1 Tax=Fictibacillus phosphorivorans TaxID=1221500 RepID=UPI001292E691|nr:methyltransferase domain-containing protein [Fictibacillus phosphorivorans]MQR94053.1 class I SAM-dependent methyltransferase [Fictibacillus phosphorivorans]